LTWRAHIIEIEYAYIPHARVSKFSEQWMKPWRLPDGVEHL
jgi:hypothetical protein